MRYNLVCFFVLYAIASRSRLYCLQVVWRILFDRLFPCLTLSRITRIIASLRYSSLSLSLSHIIFFRQWIEIRLYMLYICIYIFSSVCLLKGPKKCALQKEGSNSGKGAATSNDLEREGRRTLDPKVSESIIHPAIPLIHLMISLRSTSTAHKSA